MQRKSKRTCLKPQPSAIQNERLKDLRFYGRGAYLFITCITNLSLKATSLFHQNDVIVSMAPPVTLNVQQINTPLQLSE